MSDHIRLIIPPTVRFDDRSELGIACSEELYKQGYKHQRATTDGSVFWCQYTLVSLSQGSHGYNVIVSEGAEAPTEDV